MKFSKILKAWEEKKSDNREIYHTLYRNIKGFDKHIPAGMIIWLGRIYYL